MALGSDVLGWINDAANKFGISSSYLQRTAMIESSGNPNAYNASGASGLFQFMPSTAQQYGLSNPFDPQASTYAAAALAADNYRYMENKLGRGPTDEELYLAHQQGASRAVSWIQNPGQSISGANVTQNMGTSGMTAGQFMDMMGQKFSVNKSGSGPLEIKAVAGNDFDIAADQFLGGSGDGKAAAGYNLLGISGTAFTDYFQRLIIIVLGLIFVAVGLGLFGKNKTVIQVAKQTVGVS